MSLGFFYIDVFTKFLNIVYCFMVDRTCLNLPHEGLNYWSLNLLIIHELITQPSVRCMCVDEHTDEDMYTFD